MALRVAPLNRAERLTNRKVTTGVGTGDRIARAFEPVNDCNVAREHVGQVLQQPKRRKLTHAVPSPALEIELISFAGDVHGRREFVEIGADEAGADVAAEPAGSNCRASV